MSGYDQALTLMSSIGVALMVYVFFLVRQLDKHERELAAQKSQTPHPAE